MFSKAIKMKLTSIATFVAFLATALVAAAPVPDDEVIAVLGYKRASENDDLGYKRAAVTSESIAPSTDEEAIVGHRRTPEEDRLGYKREAAVEAAVKKEKRHNCLPRKQKN